MVDQLEISLKDLLLKVLLKWRLILASMLVVGLLFGLVGAYKNSLLNANPNESEAYNEESLEEQAEYYENLLTSVEINHVKVAVDAYYSYLAQANSLFAYMDESIYMKLDAYNVPTMQKMYQVTVNNSELQDSNTIARAYLWELDSADVYEKMVEVIDEFSTVACAKELVKFSEVLDGTFSVTITATDEAQCEAILDLIDARISKLHSSVKKTYGNYTFLDLDDKFSYQSNVNIVNDQQKIRDTYLALENYKLMLDDNFSEDQFTYFDVLVALQAENVETDTEVEEEPVTVSLINKKYIFVGLVLGILAGCGWAAVEYVFSSKLRKAEDLEIVHGIPTLVKVKSQASKKRFLGGIDKLLCRIFNGKTQVKNDLEEVCINIKMIAKKNQFTKIYLVSSCQTEEIDKFKQEVCEKLASEFEVKSGAVVLEDMLNAELIIQFEQTELSKNANIQRIVDLAQIHGIQIGGSVIFEK